ncbi:MAG: sugar phosphate isomerase/epimerase [Clostridia bacterium]|nr:sugar phosphate isomerase/epimerase [Clostridia bacterium]
MKTSVSSYSFSALGLSCEDVIAAAAEIGFDAVEFTDIPASCHSEEIKAANALRLEAEKHGICISGYSVGGDLMAEGGRDVSAEAERIMRKIDVAEALGAPLLRHDATFRFPPKGLSFEDVVGGMADVAREITVYAEKKGIRTATENHGTFCQASDRMLSLINAVDHKNYGMQVDIGNFLCVDEDPLTAVTACAPYAFNLHLKDFRYRRKNDPPTNGGWFSNLNGNYLCGTVLCHGIVPVRQCFEAAASCGYDGYITLEFEGPEDVMSAVKEGLSFMKQLVR